MLDAPPSRDNYQVDQTGYAVIPRSWVKWFSMLTLEVSSKAAILNNIISSSTTIATDTSYPVISYLTVNSDLTINGNVMVIG